MKKSIIFLLMILPIWIYAGTSLKDLYKRSYIDLKKEIIITNDAFKDKFFLKSFHSYNVSKTGAICIADYQLNKLFLFNRNGEFFKEIGQKGSGPGDLSRPGKVFYDKENIVVFEYGNLRFSAFDNAGKYIKNVNKGKFLYITGIFPLKNGKFIFSIRNRSRNNNKAQQRIDIILFDKNFQEEKVLYTRPVFLDKFMNRTNYPQPFASSFLCAVNSKDEIITGFQSEEFVTIHKAGEVSEKVFHKMKKVPVTKEHKETFFAGITFGSSDGSSKKGASREFREATTFPNFKPYFAFIDVDSEDNILLFEYPQEGYDLDAFYAFNSKNESIGRVKIREGKIRWFGTQFGQSNSVFTQRLNEDEEPELIKYRIQ